MASAQRAEAIRRSTTRLTNGSAWKASAATRVPGDSTRQFRNISLTLALRKPCRVLS